MAGEWSAPVAALPKSSRLKMTRGCAELFKLNVAEKSDFLTQRHEDHKGRKEYPAMIVIMFIRVSSEATVRQSVVKKPGNRLSPATGFAPALDIADGFTWRPVARVGRP